MTRTVRVTGADEAIATIERIEADASKPPADAGRALAAGVILEAPVRTGYLRSTVTVLDDATVVVLAPYAVYVDARTSFVAKGAARSRQAIVAAWQKSVDASIRREGAG
jgi:hypothetical protein